MKLVSVRKSNYPESYLKFLDFLTNDSVELNMYSSRYNW